jgi:ubiquitin carboxyl-terminal hydrolase 36/42
MMCRFRTVAVQAIGVNAASSQIRCFNPSAITTNLKSIAKSLRLGRQEDAHEFLRYSIDAFQRAALYGTDPYVDPFRFDVT